MSAKEVKMRVARAQHERDILIFYECARMRETREEMKEIKKRVRVMMPIDESAQQQKEMPQQHVTKEEEEDDA